MAVKGKSKAAKSVRKAKKARLKNRKVKSAIKFMIKNALVKNAHEAIVDAISKIDKAVKRGILHKNTGARKKSKLMKKFNTAKAKA